MIYDIYTPDRTPRYIQSNKDGITTKDKYENVLICTYEDNNDLIETYQPHIEIVFYYYHRTNPKTDYSNLPNLKILCFHSQATLPNLTGIDNLEELYLNMTFIKKMQYVPKLILFYKRSNMGEEFQVLTKEYHENKGTLDKINEIMKGWHRHGEQYYTKISEMRKIKY